MNQQHSHPILSVFVILMAMAACVLPGQTTPSAPGLDPNAVASAVAGTAQAAALQTAQVQPVLPAPTLDFTSAETPTPEPLTGNLKEEQPDGTTVFTDYEGGYELVFPQGWVVVNPEMDDLEQIRRDFPQLDQSISVMLETTESSFGTVSFLIFGFQPTAQQGAFVPNMNISRDTNPLLLSTALKDSLDATSAHYSSSGITVINTEIRANSSGVELGRIETEWDLREANTEAKNLHQKQAFFKSRSGVITATFTTAKDVAVDLLLDFDQLTESIQLFR